MLARMADSSTSKPLSLVFPDEAATARFGATLARALRPGDVIALSGGLGSGKSALARAVVRTFAPGEEVPSPTFTLVQTYAAQNFAIWHVDLYRLDRERDVRELGLDEALDQGAVLLIEWPERSPGLLAADRLDIVLSLGASPTARHAQLIGHGAWAARIAELAS
jgi:tRNA threonylcarbamoyladenosine biosynthesis protein TsaE